MTLFRRHSTAADSHALHVERRRNADLVAQLAEAHETIRKQARALDIVKWECRDLAGRLANTRAQLAVLDVKGGAS